MDDIRQRRPGTFLGSLECLAMLGTLVDYGQASGPVEPLPPAALAAKSNFLTRPILFHYLANRAALEAMASELFAVIEAGIIRPDAALRLRLAQADESHRALESRRTAGSVVLVP